MDIQCMRIRSGQDRPGDTWAIKSSEHLVWYSYSAICYLVSKAVFIEILVRALFLVVCEAEVKNEHYLVYYL